MASDGQRASRLIAWNETRHTQLVGHGRIARTFWQRGRGLLGTSDLPAGDGLLIERCSSIHSFWMRYRFDALFLDRDGYVVHLIPAMRPNRVSRHVFSARYVLELPAGSIEASGTEHGDRIQWSVGGGSRRDA